LDQILKIYFGIARKYKLFIFFFYKIMSDQSDNTIVGKSFLNSVNITKVTGITLLVGLGVGVTYYMYDKYYNQEKCKVNSTETEKEV